MTDSNQITVKHACELVFDAAAWHVGFASYGAANRVKRRFTCAPGDKVYILDGGEERPKDTRNIVCIVAVKYSGRGFAGDRRIITGSHLTYNVVPDGYSIVAVVIRP